MGSRDRLPASQAFPRLSPENHEITSPATPRYNCIAWAAGDARRWWWPDPDETAYWPPSAPRQETVPAFVAAFESLGYNVCENGDLEPGYEKIALYTVDANPTHAAYQRSDGRWSSKLGRSVDIAHVLEALNGPVYGAVHIFVRRATAPTRAVAEPLESVEGT